MSIFERVLGINESTFDRLMAVGMFRANAKRDLLIYEYYLEECIKYGSMQAMINASEKFHLNDESIKKIIYRFPMRKEMLSSY